MNFFVATRPETIVSVVREGKLPDKLPSYCEKTLKVATTFTGSLPQPCRIHQTFVVMGQGASLRPEAISCLLVASERAHKYVLRLFKGQCPRPVHMRPELFPKEKKRQAPTQAPPPKRIKLTVDEKKTAPWEEPDLSNRKPIPGLERLVDDEAHFDWLKDVVEGANEQILITSYGIKGDTLWEADLWSLLKQAHKFEVKTYIYYNDKSWADTDAWKFLKNNTQILDQAFTHSKIVAIDRGLLAIGSFNWLSAVSDEWDGEESTNASFVYDGKGCKELVEDVWRHLVRYRGHQHGNDLSQQSFYKRQFNLKTLVYPIAEGHTLSYLPSLETHRQYFQGIFSRAKRWIIICSPFISGHFEKDIDKQAIQNAIKKHIQIFILLQPSNLKFLLQKNFPGAHLVECSDLHQKTIIVDDNEIAEGSFNWLSAVRSDDDEYHNHEATLVLQGPSAGFYIGQFFEDYIGQVLKTSQSPIFSKS